MMKTIIKNIIQIVILAFITLPFISCEKDNFDPPSKRLSGRIVYEGKNIGVQGGKEKETNAQNSKIELQLWQLNIDAVKPMSVNVAQDGSFTALLFDGDYRLVAKDGNGPWENRHDTVFFSIKGKDVVVDYPVVPYYTVSETDFSLSKEVVSDTETYTLKASFDINRISADKTIESVSLVIDHSYFVNFDESVSKVTLANVGVGHNEVAVDVSKAMSENKGLHARIAVKVKGVSYPVFSPTVFKVK